MQQLLNKALIDGDYFAATGSGTTPVDGKIVDTKNYRSVVFIAAFGTANVANTIKVEQGDESDLSDGSDLAGTAVTVDGSNKDVKVEIYRPMKRYVRAIAVRGSATTLIGGTSILHGGRTQPPANVNAEIHVSPAEGTA